MAALALLSKRTVFLLERIETHFRNSTLLYLLYSALILRYPLAGSKMSVSIIWRHCNGHFGPGSYEKEQHQEYML
jgi:hypothetical protein